MHSLNYKHLRYFWMVARCGSMAGAAAQLHLSPQSISGQLSELAEALGVQLFRRAGRRLELTDAGRRILQHADTIFSAGDELLDLVRDQSQRQASRFRIGVADSVSKAIASRLVAPALALPEPVRLVCREGRLDALLAELAVHRLDLILADRPMPPHLNVLGHHHLLGDSALSVFAAPALAASLSGDFPACMHQAPLLLPGEDYAVRPRLLHWLDLHVRQPRIVGEFDDSAMMQAFGRSGAGLFFAPEAIAADICAQYGVAVLGTVASLREQVYAITTERRISHPASAAICQAARQTLSA